MSQRLDDSGLQRRAIRHAALSEPIRLAVVEELAVSDRSPKELAELLGIGTNLIAHHLDVLEHAGLVVRSLSEGDGRRKYVHLVRDALLVLGIDERDAGREMVFLCTHNSARSQLAAALWTKRTGRPASSAGTRPAERVHPGAVAAARRAGFSLANAAPKMVGKIPRTAQVVTVCDLVHEELDAAPDWWHWSIPDPAENGRPAEFDAVVAELNARISSVTNVMDTKKGTKK